MSQTLTQNNTTSNNKTQSLLDLISSTKNLSTYSSGISKLDQCLIGGKGFRSGGVYDISCMPGNVGKWELIFTVMLGYLESNLENELSKILILKVNNKIPWFKFRSMGNYQDRFEKSIDVFTVSSLTQLILILQSVNFSNYGLVVLDEFHGLYEHSLANLKLNLQKKKEIDPYNTNFNNTSNNNSANSLKRDIHGIPIFNPTKKLGLIIQDIMVLLNSIAKDNNSTIITLGKMDTVSQRFYRKKVSKDDKKQDPEDTETNTNNYKEGDNNNKEDEGDGHDNNAEDSDDDDDFGNDNVHIDGFGLKYITQQILVPVLSLNGPWASYFSNRIILYKDWVVDTVDEPSNNEHSNAQVNKRVCKTGLKYSSIINDYVQLIECDRLSSHPQFLNVTILPNGEKQFKSGWFKLSDGHKGIIDEDIVNVNHTDSHLHFDKNRCILDGLDDHPLLLNDDRDTTTNDFQIPNKRFKLAINNDEKENDKLTFSLPDCLLFTSTKSNFEDSINNNQSTQIFESNNQSTQLDEIPESQC